METTKRVTIYDIASELGVSPGTVSRALNGSNLIGRKRTDLILATAEKMGYRRRTIRRQRGRAILNIRIVLPRRTERAQQMFFELSDLLRGVKDGLQDNPVNLMVDVDSPDDGLFPHKKGGNIDGVIFAFTRPGEHTLAQLDARGIPCLVLHRVVEGRDYISCDNSAGMSQLLEAVSARLAAIGRIVRCCYIRLEPAREVADERQAALAAACSRCSVSFDVLRDVFAVESVDSLTPAMVRRIDDAGYNAVMCFNDVLAAAFYNSATAVNIDAARRFEITGFDNSPIRDLMRPRPDTISLPVWKIGRTAADWIQKRIIDRGREPFEEYLRGDYIEGDNQGRVVTTKDS